MSEKINCLIVDDEPIARDIIRTYCGHLPDLDVVALCGNALEAKAALQKHKIDILFLDINMPVLDGIAFLKTLKTQPQVIFTTAYKEFAVDAFDLSACDYLLKPFSLERFIVAVDKATEKLNVNAAAVKESPSGEPASENFIFVRADGKIYKIMLEELLYAEASGNYTKIVTNQSTILPGMTFSAFEALLSKNDFIRIHRSFIVNKAHITHIEGNRVFLNTLELPVGINYKEAFFRQLGL